MEKVIYALVEEVYVGDDRFGLMKDYGMTKVTLFENIVKAKAALDLLYMQNSKKTYFGVPIQYKDIGDYVGTIIYHDDSREIHRIFSIEKREVY